MQKEIKIILSEHAKWVSRLGGACANLSDADLSGANLAASKGIEYWQVAFHDHGEKGRLLSFVCGKYWCGCFSGTRTELVTYIQSGLLQFRESRMKALKVLDLLMDIQN